MIYDQLKEVSLIIFLLIKKILKWNGECYVFDQRVSIIHGSKQGSYSMCHACRIPLSDNEKKTNKYIEGYILSKIL